MLDNWYYQRYLWNVFISRLHCVQIVFNNVYKISSELSGASPSLNFFSKTIFYQIFKKDNFYAKLKVTMSNIGNNNLLNK